MSQHLWIGAQSVPLFFFLPGWVRSAACALTLEEKTLKVLLRHRFDSPTGKKKNWHRPSAGLERDLIAGGRISWFCLFTSESSHSQKTTTCHLKHPSLPPPPPRPPASSAAASPKHKTLRILEFLGFSARGRVRIPICVSTCNEHHMCKYQSRG